MEKASRMKADRKAAGGKQDSLITARRTHRQNDKATTTGLGESSSGLPAEEVAFPNHSRSESDQLKARFFKIWLKKALSRDDVVAFEQAVNKGTQIPMAIDDVSVSYKRDDGEVIEMSILEHAFYSKAVNCFKWLCVMDPDRGVGYELTRKFGLKLVETSLMFHHWKAPEMQECMKHFFRETLSDPEFHEIFTEYHLSEVKAASPLADAVLNEFNAERAAREERAALLTATPEANSPAMEKLAGNHEHWDDAEHEIPMPPLPVAPSTNSVRL